MSEEELRHHNQELFAKILQFFMNEGDKSTLPTMLLKNTSDYSNKMAQMDKLSTYLRRNQIALCNMNEGCDSVKRCIMKINQSLLHYKRQLKHGGEISMEEPMENMNIIDLNEDESIMRYEDESSSGDMNSSEIRRVSRVMHSKPIRKPKRPPGSVNKRDTIQSINHSMKKMSLSATHDSRKLIEEKEDTDYSSSEEENDQNTQYTQIKHRDDVINTHRAKNLRKIIVILIHDIINVKRELLNQLLHILVEYRRIKGINFKMLLGIGRSVESFHNWVNLGVSGRLLLKEVELPSIKDVILGIIYKYMTEEKWLIIPSPNVLQICYEQLTFYSMSFQAFIKIMTYMAHKHIYTKPLFFLTQHKTDESQRRHLYAESLGSLKEADKKTFLDKFGVLKDQLTVDYLEKVRNDFIASKENFTRAYKFMEELSETVQLPTIAHMRKSVKERMEHPKSPSLYDRPNQSALMNFLKFVKEEPEKRFRYLKHFFTNIQSYKELISDIVLPSLKQHKFDESFEHLSTLFAENVTEEERFMKQAKRAGFKQRNNRLQKLMGGSGSMDEKNDGDYEDDFNLWLKEFVHSYFIKQTEEFISNYTFNFAQKDIFKQINPDMQENTLECCIFTGDLDKEFSGQVKEASEDTLILKHDNSTIINITKDLGREINLNEVYYQFKTRLGNVPNHAVEQRFIKSIIHLKALGLFSQTTTHYIWKKNFFSKPEMRR